MVLYFCHSDTARCRAYDQTGEEYIPYWNSWDKWRIQNGELYAADVNDFPRTGVVELIPTIGSNINRFIRELTTIRIYVSALTFRRCFEKADQKWKLKGDD